MNFSSRQKGIITFLLYFAFTTVIIFLLFCFGKFIFPLIAPFVVAWIVALLLQPGIKFLNKYAKLPKSVATVILLLTLFGGFVFLSYLLIKELVGEISALSIRITDFVNELRTDGNKVTQLIETIDSYVPFFDIRDLLQSYWKNWDQTLISITEFIGSNLSTSILPFLTGTISFVTDFFFVSLIFIIAIYYIAVDFKSINKFIAHQIPSKSKGYFLTIKNQFLSTTWKYLKAYSIIIIITFCELLVAFLALGIEYPYLVALITALVDILPIIGTGTILIPWGIIMIITGDVFVGIGLLVTYLIITIVRQIIEPKIVGAYIGMYPLVTLIMMYSGLKAFGILGLFGFPIISIIIKNLNDAGSIKLWKYPEGMSNGNKSAEEISTITGHITQSVQEKILHRGEGSNAKKDTSSKEKKSGKSTSDAKTPNEADSDSNN